MQWLNEPPSWTVDANALVVTTGDKTDFWRETFYGFVHDDGHFYYKEVGGDLTAEVTLVGDYETLYDQSGLMLRVDERHWVKAGLEFSDGLVHVSTVITREYSDWSMGRAAVVQRNARLAADTSWRRDPRPVPRAGRPVATAEARLPPAA
jgi:regulation of enolase protein 1 (concanavalin A-like superfamily)